MDVGKRIRRPHHDPGDAPKVSGPLMEYAESIWRALGLAQKKTLPISEGDFFW
jgi:hypothetical protein